MTKSQDDSFNAQVYFGIFLLRPSCINALVWGLSSEETNGTLSEIHAAGVDLFLHQQGLDTTTPAGKAMFLACQGSVEGATTTMIEQGSVAAAWVIYTMMFGLPDPDR